MHGVEDPLVVPPTTHKTSKKGGKVGEILVLRRRLGMDITAAGIDISRLYSNGRRKERKERRKWGNEQKIGGPIPYGKRRSGTKKKKRF